MVKKNRLSRDQKRKAKLAKEAKRSREETALAYAGSKYKRDDLVPTYLSTETAIYEVYVMTDRRLTDRSVRSALEKLILQLRNGPLPPLDESQPLELAPGQEEEVIVQNIRRHWKELEPRPRTGDLIGVLRTTLNSIRVWSSPGAESRGYLHYIEGFLKRGGVSVEKLSSEGDLLPEPADPELLEIGRAWCEDGDREAADEFHALAREMIQDGDAETVVEVCHRLMSELDPGRTMTELMAVSIQAQKAIPPG